MAVNKLIDLALLTKYDEKIKELINAKDGALKTELLEEIGKINSFEIQIVDALPETGVAGTIYFIKADAGEYNGEQNVYKEYLWYKSKDASEGAEAEYSWELIGDTKLDLDALKADIADDVAGAYVKSIDVTTADATVGAVTTTTSTISFKNGDGDEIDSETISAITSIGTVVADVAGTETSEAVTGHDGLMSKADKAILDSLNADMGNFIRTEDADAKYFASVEAGTPAVVDNGDGSKTVTTTYTAKAADGTELQTFDVVSTEYVNAQSAVAADPENDIEGKAAVGGLLSAEDKVKIDNMDSNADAKYVASLDITPGEGVVTGNTTVTTVTVSAKNANGGEIDSDTFDVTTYGEVTQEANGLMSAADKVKLDEMTYAEEADILALFPTE